MNKVNSFSRLSVFSLTVLGIALSVGCSKQATEAPSPAVQLEPKPVSAQAAKVSARDFLSHADPKQAAEVRKHYFLIAGSGENANFSQEIIEQKKALIAKGVSVDDIACFYSIPTDEDFVEDQKQYMELAADLKECYPASPKVVWEQIQAGGVAEDFLYVYVTSHGTKPLKQVIKSQRVNPIQKYRIEQLLEAFPQMDQFYVSMDSSEDGESMDFSKIVDRVAEGEEVNDVLFTPEHLRKVIEKATLPTTKKYVVVQACYSGGFIASDEESYDKQTLRSLKDVTVLTAAHFDRSSFGCNSGGERTYFGGAYTDSFRELNLNPSEIDWQKLFQEVDAKVSVMEKALAKQMSFAEWLQFKPSKPMYFSNIGQKDDEPILPEHAPDMPEEAEAPRTPPPPALPEKVEPEETQKPADAVVPANGMEDGQVEPAEVEDTYDYDI